MPQSDIPAHHRTWRHTNWPSPKPWPFPTENLDLELDIPPPQSTPHISLHALFSLVVPVTFQIYDFIHQTRVIVLINSGSTHSFIQPRVAKFLSLALHDTSLLRVMVDNGSILECQQRCADIPLILQGHSFTVTLHLLPISDTDIVLGIDWLQQLGPVVTNYTMLSMKFHHLGSPVELRVDVQTEPLQSFAK